MSESLDKVISCISNKKSFVLEAGAGSGKTWALIETLKHLLFENIESLEISNSHIACITYTNVAKNEISERIDNHPLVMVGTIHEFLWSVISNFQTALKKIILKENQESTKRIDDLKDIIREKKINYSIFGKNLREGKIGHNDVIKLSSVLFQSYPKIAMIVASQYPFIFVDEYQDTEPQTIKLLVDDLLKPNVGKITLGFFGDSMQKIYNQGIGSIEGKDLEKITKIENFRCSIRVIELLNKMRPSLCQIASGKNREGNIEFIFSEYPSDLNEGYKKVIHYLEAKRGWKRSDYKQLFLTHKGIANKLDYIELLELYNKKRRPFGREKLYEKEEAFSDFFLNKVEQLLLLYDEQRYSEFIEMLGRESFELTNHSDKERIKEAIEGLREKRKVASVQEVYEYVLAKKLVAKTEKVRLLEERVQKGDVDEKYTKDKEFYTELMNVRYKEFAALNEFLQESTPFSTKHGVKGAEYENVLVVIDDEAWNQYNFNDLFSDNKENLNRYERTRKLLYVSCSRAKNELVLFMLSKPSEQAFLKIKSWFGEDNVKSIDSI